MHYRLEGKVVVREGDLFEWIRWFEDADWRVARTTLVGCEVSTVFVGVDYGWGDGPPIVFETMVFGGDHDGYTRRWSTWEEAEEGHEDVVKMVKGEGDAISNG